MPVKLNTGKTIKSHEELGITFPEWAALFGVALALHDGLIPMHSAKEKDDADKHVFNLLTSCAPNGHCGTVGCIGGYVAMAMGKNVDDADHYVHSANGAQRELYFPSTVDRYDRVTPQQAARAICNFLSTGHPNWRNATCGTRRAAQGSGKIKDHRKLYITFAHWLALLSVRAMLDVGALAYDGYANVKPNVHKFNMSLGATEYRCGTVGCIGGYVGMINGLMADAAADFVGSSDSKSGLHALFFPSYQSRECSYSGLTPAQAVQAIDNYLSTGRPRWHEVLGTSREVWCW